MFIESLLPSTKGYAYNLKFTACQSIESLAARHR
ncbi:MAG: hypothetical protein JMDDDDMK_05561 [Acidobacteria bacterium]|nr:hypothetical protein [Acidobacteriota bacterium]